MSSRYTQQSASCHDLVKTIFEIPCPRLFIWHKQEYGGWRNLLHRLHTLCALQTIVTWHGNNQWRQFLGTFTHFPNAVGMIDGTIHQVRRPSGPRQADFYRGDKRCHFMSSQVVVDADGLIVLLVTGWEYSALFIAFDYNSLFLSSGGNFTEPKCFYWTEAK